MSLWMMLWLGYNTGIERLFEPTFPTGPLDFFHGVRSLVPHLAAFLSVLIMLRRRSFEIRPLNTLIGLPAAYALVGLGSSLLLSRDPLRALYWGFEYGSVLIVLWAIVSEGNTIVSLDRVLTLNWGMTIFAVVSLLTAIGFLADLVLIPTEGSPLGIEAFGGPVAGLEFLGMPGTRNTGFGRFAALMALIALARGWEGKKRSKVLWLLLLVALMSLVLSQARTAVVAFLAGAFVIFWLKPGPKARLWAGAIAGLILLGLTGFYSALWTYITRGRPFDPTLTGRTLTWQEAWHLFLASPLVGLGFHADRIFPYYLEETAHTHNTLLQALVQAGVLGTIPLLVAFGMVWIFTLRLYRGRERAAMTTPPLEIPGILAFVTVSSVTESTFALFSVYWLMVAPCFAYLQEVWNQKRARKRPDALRTSTAVLFRRAPVAVVEGVRRDR